MGRTAVGRLGFLTFFLVSLGAAEGQVLNDPLLHARQVVSGLTKATAMAFIGWDDILVLSKDDGRVRRVTGGVLQLGDVLDVAVHTSFNEEQGLLGIAIHPNFASTPFVYLYYTESSTGSDRHMAQGQESLAAGNRVYRYTWNGTALVDPELLLDLPALPGPYHNAGTMTFGSDGKLYVVIGDVNHLGQLQNVAAGPSPNDAGVILRVNDDGTAPADNPFFAGGDPLARYYAYGVRNSFGLAIDPLTGALWDTENGPNVYDEINLVGPGFNSGWLRLMGPLERDAEGTADLVMFPGSHYADPRFSWLDPVGVTAITFMSSARLGIEYENDVLVGDIVNGRLYHFRVNAARDGFDLANPGLSDRVADDLGELGEVILGTGFGGITDLKVGPDGLLYLLRFGFQPLSGAIFVVTRRLSRDFDGEGHADILWRHTEGGAAVWLFDADGVASTTTLGTVPTEWVVQGVGDFNRDGRSDILWRHTPSGTVFLWFMSGSTIIGSGLVGSAGPDWTIQRVGDFNGDGWADILWRHTSGAVYVWLLKGTAIIGDAAVGNATNDWAIEGVGDVNDDGRADIVWRHTSGAVYVWLLDGAAVVDSGPVGNAAPNWIIQGVGDFDKDGRADILWRQTDGTGVVIWLLNGKTIVDNSAVTAVPAGWTIEGVTDFNADGRADVLWRHDTGDIVIWHMDGTTITTTQSPGFFDPSWVIQ